MIALAEPEYDTTELRLFGGRVVRTVKTCLHANRLPVESVVTGEVVAHLCADCDRQFA